ncbi:MAG: hypothetical protein ACI8XO_003862 [Verrucomicrobiales bacterium]
MEKNARIHLLSGVGRCGFCSQPLYSKRRSRRGGHGHYICACHHESRKGKLPKCKQPWNRIEALEELTLAFVGEMMSDGELVADIITESERRACDTVSSFPLGGPDIEKQLDQVKRREGRLMEAYEGGAIDLSELKERKKKLLDERSRIRRLAEAQNAAEKAPDDSKRSKVARRIAEGAKVLDASTSDAERKEVIKELFSEIFFRGESIIAFTFSHNLLPADGGESFSGIANGLVSLHEPFRVTEPEEPVPRSVRKLDYKRTC